MQTIMLKIASVIVSSYSCSNISSCFKPGLLKLWVAKKNFGVAKQINVY